MPLQKFSLYGRQRKKLRYAHRHLAATGCTFEVAEPPLNEALVADLRQVSDGWLAGMQTAEKGFSLGFFQPDYIRNGPVGLVRNRGCLISFANIWRGARCEELSIDLMRHLPDAPPGAMDFLFVELALWGRKQNYEWFDLGMAPLSGVDPQATGPLWNRIASLAYRHGEHFYNFQGLRQYKEKFDPVWTPKYLASPGGLALPVVLSAVATLISGGLTQIARK